ncbi:Na+/H+ antiporter NhaC family protein [Dysosmobacter sp.]|uniref:Na+/H+ antiporter NhaC family protein n=1 Tax=Dysosmobacter sp. TaxID=2591382 RepID=UPI002A8E03CD|nr:Na+/H+ antiporter NhaC family protein [Dysosmobacter sp.]MDY3281367.1 Na+/H+ antiporter NhaC family protein [Dysosmobacter sp.]
MTNKGNWRALLPIGVFLVLYIGSGVALGSFYAMPTIFVFLIALMVAFVQNPGLNFNEKMHVAARGLADDNIVTMCLIFLVAGMFSGTVKAAGGADSTVYLLLSLVPARLAVCGMFLIACFISVSMGTSVGTIAALAPIAAGISRSTGFSLPMCAAAVICGAMFGDNLSMISDTTIAAVRTQGCEMKDKFRMNFLIVLPAAVVTFLLFLVITPRMDAAIAMESFRAVRVVPYVVVLVGALLGFNVFGVLIVGTVLSALVGVATGVSPTELLAGLGDGITGMYDITVISIVVACISALIREYGGIDAILSFARKHIRSRKGAQLGIAALVAAVDVATANNTVAIILTGSIARDISTEYGVDPRRTASLLDIFASVVQGILPYGAQLLYAVSGAGLAAAGMSAVDFLPYLFYPYLMAVCAVGFILFIGDRKQ